MKDYKMLRNDDYDINSTAFGKPIEIGKIVKIPEEDDVMYIGYDRLTYAHYHLHCCFTMRLRENGQEAPAMIMDDFYRELFYEHPKVFEALAMHELGHYLNGDYLNIDAEEHKRLRLEAISNGRVVEAEAMADRFAVKQVGKNAVMNALDLLIKHRKERNDSGMMIAIKEFEIRKKLIKRI